MPIYLFGADGFKGGVGGHYSQAVDAKINVESAYENHRSVELSLPPLRDWWDLQKINPQIYNVAVDSTYKCYEKISEQAFVNKFMSHLNNRDADITGTNSTDPSVDPASFNEKKLEYIFGLLLERQGSEEASIYLREPILQLHDLVYKSLLPSWRGINRG